MQDQKKVLKCRICDNKFFYSYLNLGDQPPSNSFIFNKNQKEKKYPLRVILCKKCSLSQLDTVVSHKKIFDKYAYLSSSSKALVEHYNKNNCLNQRRKKGSISHQAGHNTQLTNRY